ncbi:MAG TPA: flagellar hook-basal body complex protein [Steroidobacteraceae bacterium]|jgi:flagellar basal-body rod protein FlgG
MFDALYIGAMGMRAQQSQVDTIANNVANLNTVGFRRSEVSFSAVTAAMDPTSVDPVQQASMAAQLVRGAGTLAHISMSADGGQLKQTSAPLDLAIDGAGFFEVVRADGSSAYTRAGNLQLNADGTLAAADGTPLAGHLQFSPDTQSIQIAADGTVTAVVGGQTQPVQVGRIELASFTNPAGLQAIGSNLFVATAESGEARLGPASQEGRGAIRQGYLESSNVQLTDELSSMLVAQRSFELDGRVIQAADQMMAITNSLYRT